MKHSVFVNTTCILNFVILFLLPTLALSNPLTPHEFIATALKDHRLEEHKEMLLQNEHAPKDTPFIQGMEFRVELDDLETQNQTYQVRFYPRAFGETKSKQKLNQAVLEIDKQQEIFLLSNALKKRYELVLELLKATTLLKLDEALQGVYLDKVTVLQQKGATEISSEVSEIVSAEDKLLELQLEIIELKNRVGDLKKNISGLTESNAKVDFSDEEIIDIKKISATILKYKPSVTNTNIYLEKRKLETELSQCELDLEKAQNRDYISFFQVSYASNEDQDEEWKEKTSVEIGVKLPFINSGKEENWRQRSELNRDKFQYELKKKETYEVASQLLRDLDKQLIQYDLLTNRREKGNAAKTLNQHLASEGTDPLDLLKLKESIIELDLRISELSFEIRLNFIELLDQTGRLTQEPLTDYISKELEPLL